MVKEVKTQAKIGVGVDILWKALAKNLKFIIPKMIPNLVKDAEVIEGDGGLGTVYLFNFGPDIKTMTYQKEKISELDDSLHRIALQVIEGGHLNLGFSYYNTIFQLTAIGEGETLIDVTVAYESEIEDDTMPSKTKSSTLAYISSLENYLANASSC
ncbi:phytohormone-binding protein [Ricinus communis]|uniref:phytohormone-binding protein n=1 Tax=Ricinus communis TaxID=3988 RepID=UPI000772B184|nr:phytohormone-binding protein [Ricinus communis]|eukprot:XP_015583566.1 phytohormone-binding protein [Ricinus communis]